MDDFITILGQKTQNQDSQLYLSQIVIVKMDLYVNDNSLKW